MKYTSAQANKELKRLNEKITEIMNKELRSCTFLATLGEDPESVRPEYDFEDTQKELDFLCREVRKLKHAINLFNSTTTLPNGMTIDEALVYIPQLSTTKKRLERMITRLPKERERAEWGSKAIVDYRYANYDIDTVKKCYETFCEELSWMQLELDKVNNSIEFEVE